MNPAVLLRGGRVIDETGERAADVLVRDGVIAEVAPLLDAPPGATVLDADGAVVAPGLVDIQVHFREPGREDSETVDTGARGAALGGFTAVVCMPNTTPPLDDAAVVQAVLERGAQSVCDVHVAGCITRGREGKELAPLGELYDVGVRVFTDDGDCVADAGVMRRALEYSTALPGAVIAQHAEDPALVAGGHMHEGEWSSRLGIPGRPAEAEITIVARDLVLAERAGARYHVLHMSTAGAAALVRDGQGARRARDRGGVAAAPLAHRRGVRRLRPRVQDEPAVAHAGRRRRGHRGRWSTARSTPSRPTTRRTRPRPRPFRSRKRRRACSGPRPRSRSRSRSWSRRASSCARVGARAALVAAGARSPGSREHGGPIAAGRPAHLCVIDPSETWVVDATAAREPLPQLAVRRVEADRPGAAHDLPRRAGRDRRRGATVRRERRSWCSPTARCSKVGRSGRARATAWSRARSSSTPRWPDTRRSSPTRRTRARSSRSRTRTSATTA